MGRRIVESAIRRREILVDGAPEAVPPGSAISSAAPVEAMLNASREAQFAAAPTISNVDADADHVPRQTP